MSAHFTRTVTQLLRDWGAGSDDAFDKLVPIVYAELREQAARYLRRERSGHTLQTTALVHEAYLRLIELRRIDWQNRAQFFAIAARLMRRILVEHARSRRAAKRGADPRRVPLDVAAEVAVGDAASDSVVDVLALDDALGRLEEMDPRRGRIVELRYFAGLPVAETAEALGISPATVQREWATARAWLRRELSAR
jgi:RNA polymerase sigma factor (TIGR02999 family)